MKYYQITVHTVSEAVEAISYAFSELGAGGVEIFDPTDILSQECDHVNWDYIDEEFAKELQSEEVLMRCYFSEAKLTDKTALEDLLLRLQNALSEIAKYLPIGTGAIETNLLEEENWANAWKQYYKPFKLGKKLHIVPSWMKEETALEDGEIPLFIDPGMAFGSGTHETTALCLETLEQFVRPGMDIIDIGCGSGILGIASVKMGAKASVGTDLDPAAIIVSHENAELNGTVNECAFYQGDLAEVEALKSFKGDIVVANIMADIIIRLAPEAIKLLKPNGRFVTSGIITERRAEVEEALFAMGYHELRGIERNGWCCLVFEH